VLDRPPALTRRVVAVARLGFCSGAWAVDAWECCEHAGAMGGVGRCADLDGAVMCVHDFLDDGETEAGSSAGSAAVVVETGETFEYPFAVLGGDSGSVVVDDKCDGAVVGVYSDSYRGVSVSFGVVEQVLYDAFELGSVAGDASAGDIG